MTEFLFAEAGGAVALVIVFIIGSVIWHVIQANMAVAEIDSRQASWRRAATALMQEFAEEVEGEDGRVRAILRGREFDLSWRDDEPTEVDIDLAPQLAAFSSLRQLHGGARIERELAELGVVYTVTQPSEVLAKLELLFELHDEKVPAETRQQILAQPPYPHLEFAFDLRGGAEALEAKVSAACDLASRIELLLDSAADELLSVATAGIGTDDGYDALRKLVRQHDGEAATHEAVAIVMRSDDLHSLVLLARHGHVSASRIHKTASDVAQPVAARIEAGQWLRTQPDGVPSDLVCQWLTSDRRALRTFGLETAAATPQAEHFPALEELARHPGLSTDDETKLVRALSPYEHDGEAVMLERLENIGPSIALFRGLAQIGGQPTVDVLRGLRLTVRPPMLDGVNTTLGIVARRLGLTDFAGSLSVTDVSEGRLALSD